ncbi:DNA-3-methyladenine glycosylase 2 family protein [Arenicella xantha]|uniref:DNA-3-methyladenine glycosylase II n=1 Tax=Arenicella xantha TaxID=644221 RepID=A0A395JSB1_9GAMM|nr:AlkA N-terminal domain-containing protein [Arenicella xantha]RBP51580.1 DNA-3-methyladenine glycosylase II [Arenicella xantha]
MAFITDQLTRQRYALARQARDARFDGEFFIAVKTTGIYCRPICPANSPLEKNVDYYESAISAAHDGFRPCLRCRPDSAPHSCAWRGTDTTFRRALKLIEQGALQQSSVTQLSDRLGISDRYLRDLFQAKLGTSPKKYALYQQCLFAKQLLHESALSVTDIGFAAGFNSVRRFNEAMQQQLGLAPRDIRKDKASKGLGITLRLYYRPPYAWQALMAFLAQRCIDGLEWCDGDIYGRTIQTETAQGYFQITKVVEQNRLDLTLHLDDYRQLNAIVQRVRSLFDVDAPIARIDEQLQALLGTRFNYLPGLRVPGIWNSFEAGVRAILGQQVSVAAARKLVTLMVHELGQTVHHEGIAVSKLFPTPTAVSASDLAFLRMPGARKQTLRRLADHMLTAADPDDVDAWIDIKGIGPWTINYVKLRGSHDSDVWLDGDAGIRNAMQTIPTSLDIDQARPWRSYLTFQLWNQL